MVGDLCPFPRTCERCNVIIRPPYGAPGKIMGSRQDTMPEIEILLAGYTFNTDQANLGLSTVTLVRGEVLTIIDVAHHGRRSQLLEQLRQRGVDPSDIARVVLTHAHWDHCQNTDLFPNADIILHEKELEYTRNPRDGDFATARYFADTLRAHNVRLVSGEIELEPGSNPHRDLRSH